MFYRKPPAEDEGLEKAIVNVLDTLTHESPSTKEYAAAMTQLARLYDLRPKPAKEIDPNTLITAGANLLGILLIIRYERANIITSKALGFVLKLR